MSYSIGFSSRWNRDIGYGVPAICDHPGCNEEIDRGLSYYCGGPGFRGEEWGCGLYFCEKHLKTAGPKREYAQLCTRCYHGCGDWYTPKPDVRQWIEWKLTDESWAEWRKENPEWVEAHK